MFRDDALTPGIAQQLVQLLIPIVQTRPNLTNLPVDLDVVGRRPLGGSGELPVQVASLIVRRHTDARDRRRLRIINRDHPAAGLVHERPVDPILRRHLCHVVILETPSAEVS